MNVPKSVSVKQNDLGPVATPARPEGLDGTRLALLEALDTEARGATIDELATHLDVHPNSVRNHIAALDAGGFVDSVAEPPAGRGRPPRRYTASVAAQAMLAVARAGTHGGGSEYRALAEAFARHLARNPDAVAEARSVGELWGSEVVRPRAGGRQGTTDARARRAVLKLLTDLGFAPEPGDGPVVRLRSCPLLESARENPDVICSVHLGLVAGARRALGAREAEVELEPFAEPGACRLHLPLP